jgi:hypothetical protein
MWPHGAGDEAAAAQDAEDDLFTYPEGDFVKLSSTATREGDQIVMYLQADLDDTAFPFRLSMLLGARFDVPGETLDAEHATSTLVWLCFPYVRELVSSITGRSPLPPYYLPALTKMPHPSVLAEPSESATVDAS